jgi:hypothetical protein
MTEMTYDRKFIWPKAFLEKWSFDRKVIWPKVCLTESFFRKIAITPIVYLTECFFSKNVRKSFWQKVKQSWFIIRIGKAFLIFESASNQNRAWLPRCLRRHQAPCPRWKYKTQLNFLIHYNLLLYILYMIGIIINRKLRVATKIGSTFFGF